MSGFSRHAVAVSDAEYGETSQKLFGNRFSGQTARKNLWRHMICQNPLLQHWHHLGGHRTFSATEYGDREKAAPRGHKGEKRSRHVMWRNLLRHCAVLTKVSEEFAPHYLAGIRHDMRQTTLSLVAQGSEVVKQGQHRLVDPHWLRGSRY